MAYKKLICCVSLMALMAPVSALQAQTTPQASEDEGGLGDIIVTARKVEENLQDVPVAVTAFTGQALENQNLQRVENLANFTPGMSIRPGSSTPSAVTITLRGQVQTDILATLDPSVGTYVDGVYWARAYGLNSDVLDAQSVQVLKGPQGTLFGRNTTGGALLINTNNPDLDEFGGRVSFTYGRFNEMNATGILNLPIVPGFAGLRVAVQRFTRDGYTRNVSTSGTALTGNTVIRETQAPGSPAGTRLDNRDRWNFRAKFDIAPSDNLRFQFSAERFDMDEYSSRQLRMVTNAFTATNSTYNTANTGALFVGLMNGAGFATAASVGTTVLNGEIARMAADPTIALNNENSYASATTNTFGFNATLDTSVGQFKLTTGIRNVRTYAGLDLEGSSYPVHFTEGQQSLKQKSAELQWTGTALNDAIDFALGGFIFHEEGFDQSISITVPALNPATSHFYGLINTDSVGAYGQVSWHLTDALTFTGGLRYSVDDKGLETRNNNYLRNTGMTVCSVIPVTPFNVGEVVGPAQCAFGRSDEFSGWSWTAGLDYRINDDVMVYAKASRGFRAGGQNLRAPNTAAFLPFLPETALSYEAGFKSELLDRRLRINAAVYQTDVSDIQRSTLIATAPIPPSTVSGTATILGNAGKARFRGAEIELQALVADGFTITATGALTDPNYIRFADLSGDRSFERFVGISRRQFSLAADYRRDIGSDSRLRLHVDYSWRSAQNMSEYNWVANPQNDAIIAATTAPSQGLLGARAALEIGDNYEVAVFGRNITNDRSYVSALAVLPLGYIQGTPNEPATYGVTATIKF